MAESQKQTFLIIDDHELVLGATRSALEQAYPEANLVTAQSLQDAMRCVELYQPSLAVVDLSIPDKTGDAAQINVGIQLLKHLMQQHPILNIVVQSAHVKTLVRLKPLINEHEGGFTIADKSLPMKEMLTKVDWALQGLIYTPRDMRNGLEVKPEWLDVLLLAFQEGLQDKAIAERMNVSERTVRHYWTKIQDVLEVYPDEGKNVRIQTEIYARQAGLID
ncbi:response regulator transcription factor [Vacuolonema iberomarrocanum]|uniref:response regulator transcription factor n=1 Tax=Vacuolonema iberomarrocanum TaxID=3454632 RepID=UPI001A0F6A8F|nr:response regulator transcription factor [filamentous cyanobacterium LEGE 07170]